MTWQPFDCHAHTTWSDGELSVEELIATVQGRGVRPSVADHISRDVAGSIKTIHGARDYLDVLSEYDIGRGGEFCWHDSLWRELDDAMWGRFTHRIGSLHAIWLPNGELVYAFSRAWPSGLTAASYIDALLDNLERAVADMPIDILAHPTLVNLAMRDLAAEELWSEDQEERMVRLLAASGVAFELSTRYRPHERLVRRAAAAGVRFSLGSDGHRRHQVGDITFSIDLARRCGVADSALYDPAVHGRRELGARK